MAAIVLFRHSALWEPRPRQSSSRPAFFANSPATRRVQFQRSTGMRANVAATCKCEPLGKRLERSNFKPT
eukprot:4792891-Pyramimonas_sp.AAC.1